MPLVPGPAPEVPRVLADATPGDVKDPGEAPAAVVRVTWEEAWILAGRLRVEGIPATVYPEDYASAYGRTIHTAFEVMVRTRDLDRARGVVAEYASHRHGL